MKKNISIFIVTAGLALAATVYAQTAPAQPSYIPGLEFLQVPVGADIGMLLTTLYVWGLGFVALAAFFMLTWGGVLYMFAGDRDPSDAKSKMKNAVYGLLLALGSYLILYTINPDLVNVKITDLPKITAPQSGQQSQPIIGTATRNQPCVPGSSNPSEVCQAGPDVCITVLRISTCTR